MSDEDAAAFDAHHEALEKIRSTPSGAAFLAFVETLAKETGKKILEAGAVIAPIALELGKEALVSFATSQLEGALNKK